jgi:sec-independent protein translocase protein TatB
MLDIGWSELLVVAIVAIVVVGPKDLPKLMRTFGIYVGKVRRMAADFQRQFKEAMAESEADEVRKNIEAIRASLGTTEEFPVSPDKPLMTDDPMRSAVGATPLGNQGVESPPVKPKRAPTQKFGTSKTAKKAASRKKAAAKSPADRATKISAKAKGKGKAATKSERETKR